MTASAIWAPERRDVIWIDFNPQTGKEMKDMHPLLVLSPRMFSERTGLVIGLPLTTARYNENNPFAVKLIGTGGVTSYILTEQPKSFDWRKRGAKPHPMGRVPPTTFTMACESLEQIISLSA